MPSQHLDALARDLESLGRFAEAEVVRLRIVSAPVPVEVARASREAEAVGDWGRWAALLARRSL
jgi:Tfp pilus assembly protein FimT